MVVGCARPLLHPRHRGPRGQVPPLVVVICKVQAPSLRRRRNRGAHSAIMTLPPLRLFPRPPAQLPGVSGQSPWLTAG